MVQEFWKQSFVEFTEELSWSWEAYIELVWNYFSMKNFAVFSVFYWFWPFAPNFVQKPLYCKRLSKDRTINFSYFIPWIALFLECLIKRRHFVLPFNLPTKCWILGLMTKTKMEQAELSFDTNALLRSISHTVISHF